MALIDSTTATSQVGRKTVVWRMTVDFDNDGNIKSVDLHAKRSLTVDGQTTEVDLGRKTVAINPADAEQKLRLQRIDNSADWLWRNS